MVKNNFAIMTLASLALTCGASSAYAEDNAMFSMDDEFGIDSTFEVDSSKSVSGNEKSDNNQKKEQVADEASNAPDVALDEIDVDAMFAEEAAPSASTEANDVAPTSFDDTVGDLVPAPVVKDATTSAPRAVSVPAKANIEVNTSDSDVFAQMQKETKKVEPTMPSEEMLGNVDSAVFREMAAIERETALLELKAKKEKLLAEIENSKAAQRRNQLDELERREQITRNRINWEREQELAAEQREFEKEQAKLEAERQKQQEEERLRQEAEMREQQKQMDMQANQEIDEDIATLYTIEEVRGLGGDLFAILISDGGTINVREGYPLKYGYKVSKVTTSFVEVKKGDKVEMLRFASKGNIDR